MTRELVIKPSFNLSLVIRNCQRRGTEKSVGEIIMLIRANTQSRAETETGLNGDYNKRRIRDGKPLSTVIVGTDKINSTDGRLKRRINLDASQTLNRAKSLHIWVD